MGTLFKHLPCNLCGEDDTERLGKPKISEKTLNLSPLAKHVSVVRCKRCGFYYTDPMPFWSQEDLQTLYDNEYFPPMTKWWQRTRTEVNPRRRLNAIEQQATSKIANFLEIGCGVGYGMAEAAKRGWSVQGEDVSQAFARQVEERLGIDILVGTLEEARYADNCFDAIYVDSVLEHTPRPAEMLREIHRILKPNGIAYAVTTNEDALINSFRGLLSRLARLQQSPKLSPLQYPYHLVGFNRETFRMLSERIGFEVRSLTVCSGANEWRKLKMPDWRSLFFCFSYYPVYRLGDTAKRGISIEAVIVKRG